MTRRFPLTDLMILSEQNIVHNKTVCIGSNKLISTGLCYDKKEEQNRFYIIVML